MRRPLPLLMVAACTFDAAGVPAGDDAPADARTTDERDAPPGAPDAAPPDAAPPVAPDAAVPDAAPACAYEYRAVTVEATWAAAAADCADDTPGLSHLVVLEDDAENTGVDGLTGNAPIWVGVTDEVTEGTWVTVLGGVQTYLPWGGNAPDGSGDCAERAGNGRWNDLPCASTRRYLCECAP